MSTFGFPKSEHLCSKSALDALLKTGKWGSYGHFKYCRAVSSEGGECHVMVSVPKKHFKRAVKRNLLKRRTREAYRLQKSIIEGRGLDILFFYNSPEVAESSVIFEEIGSILRSL